MIYFDTHMYNSETRNENTSQNKLKTLKNFLSELENLRRRDYNKIKNKHKYQSHI